MCNWTYNVITFKKKKTARKYLTSGCMDFNRLVKQPEELKNTISGVHVRECVAYYLLQTRTLAEFRKLMNKRSLICFHAFRSKTKKGMSEELLKITGDDPCMYADEFTKGYDRPKHTPYEVGEFYYGLFEKFGYKDWCEWRIDHWGTKWNACDGDYDGDYIVRFDTAWSAPEPIFEQICKENPGEEIEFESTYEEGYWVKWTNINGVLSETDSGEYTYEEIEDEETVDEGDIYVGIRPVTT